MFSFQIGVASQEEEVQSAESAAMSENVRTKLQEILQFLNRTIGQSVQDAEPIRTILKTLEGQLPEPIEEALTPAAFIESHRVQVLQQEQIIKQRDDLKGLVDSTRSEIDSLNQSQAGLGKNQRRTGSQAGPPSLGTQPNQPGDCYHTQ